MECAVPWGEHSSQTGWWGKLSPLSSQARAEEDFLFDSKGEFNKYLLSRPYVEPGPVMGTGRNDSSAFQPCKSS